MLAGRCSRFSARCGWLAPLCSHLARILAGAPCRSTESTARSSSIHSTPTQPRRVQGRRKAPAPRATSWSTSSAAAAAPASRCACCSLMRSICSSRETRASSTTSSGGLSSRALGCLSLALPTRSTCQSACCQRLPGAAAQQLHSLPAVNCRQHNNCWQHNSFLQHDR